MIENRMEQLLMLGFGGHAKSMLDTIWQANKYHVLGALDCKEKVGLAYNACKVIGTDELLEKYYKQGIKNVVIGIGYMGEENVRARLYEKVKRIGFYVPAIVDQTAIIAKDVRIGEGAYIGKGAIVNADTDIGEMSIINTGAQVDHECIVGGFSHVAVGAVLAGNVVVNSHSFVGAGSVIREGIKVGCNAIIGAGSVVIRDIENNCKVVGNPARVIERK